MTCRLALLAKPASASTITRRHPAGGWNWRKN
jgi:hypothetical protein